MDFASDELLIELYSYADRRKEIIYKQLDEINRREKETIKNIEASKK